MTSATLDRLLAVLITTVGATGLLTLRAGTNQLTWLFVVHELLAGSLLAAVALKLLRSIPRAAEARHWIRLAVGLLVTALAVGSIAAGYAWVASGGIPMASLPGLGSVTVLTLHVWLGLALLPIVLVHLLPRRWRLLRPTARVPSLPRRILTRRSVVTGLGLGAISVAAFAAAEVVERSAGIGRRFTGSRMLPDGGIPPATTFFGESTPSIDREAWRVTISGRVLRPGSLTLRELQALGESELEGTLDCTSGWAMTTIWRGVPLQSLLDWAGEEDGVTTIEIRSVTGWGAAFQARDAGGLMLATGVAGTDLPAGNGAPCRLVAPGRRGLDWVKWLAEVRIS